MTKTPRAKPPTLPTLAAQLFKGKPKRPQLPAPIERESVASIGLALGSGGARGIGIIPILEAFDELGIRPAAIAGTSIGAIMGAAYAAGFSGRDLRSHVLRIFRDRRRVASLLFETRIGRFIDLFGGLGNPVMVEGERLLERFWPEGMPTDFAGLGIPFTAIAANLVTRDEARLSSGPLASAVAASLAIPGLVKPVEREGLVLIDGFVVNPVPVDVVARRTDVVVAVDLSGAESIASQPIAPPNAYQALYRAASIMERRLMLAKFATTPPQLHLTPNVGPYGALDFLKTPAILRAAEPMKEYAKRKLHALLETA